MCKVYTGYCGTSEIEHALCACTVDNPFAKARGLSLRTGAQTMLYLSLNAFILLFDGYGTGVVVVVSIFITIGIETTTKTILLHRHQLRSCQFWSFEDIEGPENWCNPCFQRITRL